MRSTYPQYPKISELILSNRVNSSFCPLRNIDLHLYDINSREVISLKQDGSDSLTPLNNDEVFLLELVTTQDGKEIIRVYQVNDNIGLHYLIGQCVNLDTRHSCCKPRLVKVKLAEQ
jgi:hypothetical protein